MAIKFLAKKHGVPEDVDAEVQHTLRPLLEEAREAVDDGGYVLSRSGLSFTYADVALAAAMQVVRPRQGSKLGPATREAWTNEALAREFEDLLAWRDAIYGKHR
jgi:glutathione S-transferase